MDEIKRLREKFSLEIDADDELPKEETSKSIFDAISAGGKMCFNHDNTAASFQCPICSNWYCNKCSKTFTEKGVHLTKKICKNCWRNFLLKTFFCIFSILSLIFFAFFLS